MSDAGETSPEIDAAQPGPAALAAVKAAFGKENRERLLESYFAEQGAPSSENAWQHAYRLLLWIDRTTGLAHCYESDKSQPGRHWYDRSLAFHAWVAGSLRVSSADLGVEIDWLFKRAIEDFAAAVARTKRRQTESARSQRAPYEGLGMPEPGEDPELVAIVQDLLGPYFASNPSADVWRLLIERIRAHLTQENKRKNLVGEGFEDTLAAIVSRIPAAWPLRQQTRVPVEEIRGFNRPRPNEKPKKVDLYVINEASGERTLVTAKWSIRADREEQFVSDFEAYSRLESEGESFDYTLLTNEFDPARLVAACERRSVGRELFTHVVHINPDGLRAAYGHSPTRSAAEAVRYIDERRLISLADWLGRLSGIR